MIKRSKTIAIDKAAISRYDCIICMMLQYVHICHVKLGLEVIIYDEKAFVSKLARLEIIYKHGIKCTKQHS